MRAGWRSVLRVMGWLVACGFVWVVYLFEGGLSAPVTITVRPGDTVETIEALLYDQGVLHHPALLKLSAKVSGNALTKIQPGAYTFAGNCGWRVIQATLGRAPIPVRITIPEGFTASQIAALLESEGIVSASEFLRAVNEMEYAGFSRPPYGWEGFLYPDTYEFPEGLTAEEVARRMVARFFERLPPKWKEIVAESDRSLTEIVIVASLVQREAFLDSEMPIIASVIYNRLRKEMPLQIDATIAYALNKWGQRLTYDDLKTDHPYNTYTRKGLPPGPIGNPGRPALIAALLPAKTDYLYFVTDGKGAHRFSRTYSEHRVNVELERRNRNKGPANPLPESDSSGRSEMK